MMRLIPERRGAGTLIAAEGWAKLPPRNKGREIAMDVVERVKSILFTPDTEWKVIAHEPGDAAYLFTNYVVFLAAIPAIAGFIGLSIVGVSPPNGSTVRVPLLAGLIHAIVGYLLTFVIVYVVAVIIDMLAPTFAAEKNFANALKLAVYSYTPAWIAGIFMLMPGLRFLGILGLYGLYLLWKGLPPLMNAPQEKSLGYAAAIVACAIVISLVVTAILSALLL
jgi:hypothetical protein